MSTQTALENYLSAARAFAKACDALVDAWSQDEDCRNRPNRHKLSEKACSLVPPGLAVGDLADAIAKECQIKLR